MGNPSVQRPKNVLTNHAVIMQRPDSGVETGNNNTDEPWTHSAP